MLDIERLNRQGKKGNRMCPELARSTPGAAAYRAAVYKVTDRVHRLGGMQEEARYLEVQKQAWQDPPDTLIRLPYSGSLLITPNAPA